MSEFLTQAGLSTYSTLVRSSITAARPTVTLITLKSTGWTNKIQTVTVAGISSDEAAQRIIPIAHADSRSAYNEAGCMGVGQGEGSLTFKCETVPSVDLKVWVEVKNVKDTTFYAPVKGSIISMDLDGQGAKQYRVIKSSGEVAQVMAMYDTLSSVYNSTSTTTTFGSTTAQKYENSTLDTYLNTTWYNTLTGTAKAAIIPENVVQHCYQYYDEPNTPNTPTYTYQYQYNWSDSDYENANDVGNVTVGNRNVFALDLKDIFDYFDKVYITSNELMTLFWNSTAKVSKYLWLRSSLAGGSGGAWDVYGNGGSLFDSNVDSSRVVRPALNLDMSKIQFTVDPPPVIEEETWVINENIPANSGNSFVAEVNFSSNGEKFTKFSITYD